MSHYDVVCAVAINQLVDPHQLSGTDAPQTRRAILAMAYPVHSVGAPAGLDLA